MPLRQLVVAVLLFAASTPLVAAEPKNLLLVGQSPDNHPRGTHEYAPGVERLAKLLEPTEGLKLRIAKADEPWPEGPELIARADGVVIFLSEGARWTLADPRRHDALAQLAARGGGLVAIHWALGTRAVEPIEPFLKLFGGCHGGPDRKYQAVQTELRPAEPEHPIAAGIKPLAVREEFYYRLKLAPGIRPVMQATIDGRSETVAWAYERPDGGRSFGFSGLHFHDNWQLPDYQRLLKQAVLWTLKLPLEQE
ncbi:MAG: ThuA domain-containing protein [Pirellulales bacterium]